jgi:hypothetical protein
MCSLGNALVIYVSASNLNSRMCELRLNKKRAAVRVMLSLESDGSPPKEKISETGELSSVSMRRARTSALERSSTTSLTDSFTVTSVRKSIVQRVKGSARGVTNHQEEASSLGSKSRLVGAGVHVTESKFNSFVEAVDAAFNYFDLDDGGSVDFSEFREFIAQAYPLCTQMLVREVLNKMRTLTDHTGEVCIHSTLLVQPCPLFDPPVPVCPHTHAARPR